MSETAQVLIRGLKIYYNDKPPYSGDFLSAPGWGVIDVIQMDDANERTYHQGGAGADYYIKRDGKIVGVDLCGMLDHVVNELCIVKVGRTINTKRFIEIRKTAEADFKK